MLTINAADYPAIEHAQAVRDAIVQVLASDGVIELIGEFQFGDDVNFPRQTVVVPGGIEIRGRTNARITGGGAKAPTTAWGGSLDMHSGALKVANHGQSGGGDKQRVAINGIAFNGWRGAAIFIEAAEGVEIQGCEFTEPVSGEVEGFIGADQQFIQNVNAIWAVGMECRGRLEAKGNNCNLSAYCDGGAPADDEQFLACFATNFERIGVTDNNVIGNDDGIEVILNNLHDAVQQQVHIDISRNKLKLNHGPKSRWPYSGGIICCRNDEAKVDLRDNIIRTSGSGGAGMALTGEHLAGEARKITVSGNRIEQVSDAEPHFAGIIMGFNAPMGGPFPGSYSQEKLGASLAGATIKDNHLSGSVRYGYITVDVDPADPNKSHHILIQATVCPGLEFKLVLAATTRHIRAEGPFEPYANGNSVDNVVVITEALAKKVEAQAELT